MDKTRIKIRNWPRLDRLNLDRPLLPSLRCVRLCEARLLCVRRSSFGAFAAVLKISMPFAVRYIDALKWLSAALLILVSGAWNWLVCGAAASEIASLRPQNRSQNTPKSNLAAKSSNDGGFGAYKITLSWKIMVTYSKIDVIAHFHNAKCQNMATLNCISVWSAIFPWLL